MSICLQPNFQKKKRIFRGFTLRKIFTSFSVDPTPLLQLLSYFLNLNHCVKYDIMRVRETCILADFKQRKAHVYNLRLTQWKVLLKLIDLSSSEQILLGSHVFDFDFYCLADIFRGKKSKTKYKTIIANSPHFRS